MSGLKLGDHHVRLSVVMSVCCFVPLSLVGSSANSLAAIIEVPCASLRYRSARFEGWYKTDPLYTKVELFGPANANALCLWFAERARPGLFLLGGDGLERLQQVPAGAEPEHLLGLQQAGQAAARPAGAQRKRGGGPQGALPALHQHPQGLQRGAAQQPQGGGLGGAAAPLAPPPQPAPARQRPRAQPPPAAQAAPSAGPGPAQTLV